MLSSSHTESGFTLLELLVAIAIFAVLAAMAYGGLNTILNTSHYAAIQVERLTRIQFAVATLSRDFFQVADRQIRDEYGDQQLSFLAGGPRGNKGIEFTRGGRRNPGGFLRSSLQRVGYAVQEGQLLRFSWKVLDRAQDNTPMAVPIIDRVEVDGLTFRFLDANGIWHNQWPPDDTKQLPTDTPISTTSTMPRAVEMNLNLEDFGRITRLYPIY